MLAPAFKFSLDSQILPRLVAIGKFDGKTPTLVCVTTGGKVLLHSPHEASGSGISPLRFLNFNRKVTSIAVGTFGKSPKQDERDLLFIGTQTNILAYDVERNADVFYKEVQDGVNTLMYGQVGNQPKPLLYVGGNCSVFGFGNDGNEAFWTVTGDNVSSLAICDINSDGLTELVVGSDDFEIRSFRNEEIIGEISESDKIVFLVPLNGSNFAYGLGNGTVGVYNGLNGRLWRVKTKNKVAYLTAHDVDSDGVPEVLIGWSNGGFQIRKADNGDVIHKDKFSGSIASIICCDYRMDGKTEIMICFENGEVSAFIPADAEILALNKMSTNYSEGAVKSVSAAAIKALEEDQKLINDLQLQKQDLINELKSLEKTNKAAKAGPNEVIPGSLPGGTSLSYTLVPDLVAAALTLRIEVSSDVVIVNIIAVDLEGGVLNDTEVLAITPSTASRLAILPLRPSKFTPCNIRVQTHIASRTLTSQLHVYEKDISIPKFSSFLKLPDVSPVNGVINLDNVTLRVPNSKVMFVVQETTAKFAEFVYASFIISGSLKLSPDRLRAQFVSVCGHNLSLGSKNRRKGPLAFDGGDVLIITATRDEGSVSRPGVSSSKTVSLNVSIESDDMDVIAEIIQEMGKFFKLTELNSEADFPEVFRDFADILEKVDQCNAQRIHLTADMADDSQHVKALVVRAEDSRLMGDMKIMKRAYTELFAMNNQLISNYNLRSNNHETLLQSLKEVNQMIQKTANLRLGRAKSSVISECRSAVKENNIRALINIMRSGSQYPNN